MEYKVELTVNDSARARLAVATDPSFDYDWDLYNIMINSVSVSHREFDTVSVPYEPEDYDEFIILNVNDDYEMDGVTPTTWNVTGNILSIDSPFDGTDDWAISHLVELEEGKYYELSLSHDIEEGMVELYLGNARTPERMEEFIAELTGKDEFTHTFQATGNVAIGLHAPNTGSVGNVNTIAIREYTPPAGVQGINTDDDGKDTIYYNLNGVKTEKPDQKGVYIVYGRDKKITKLVVE